MKNALARLGQTQGIPDAEKAKIKSMLQNILRKLILIINLKR